MGCRKRLRTAVCLAIFIGISDALAAVSLSLNNAEQDDLSTNKVLAAAAGEDDPFTNQQSRNLLSDGVSQPVDILPLLKIRSAPPPPKKRRRKRPPPPPPSKPQGKLPCSLVIDGVETKFQHCSNMADFGGKITGRIYYLLQPDGTLIVGYKSSSTSAGYLAWAWMKNGGMIGAEAAFAYNGADGPKGGAYTLSGYTFERFQPSKAGFSDAKAGKTPKGELAGMIKFKWPAGESSIPVALASGPVGESPMGGVVPQIHYGIPMTYTLPKATLKQTQF